VKKVASAFVVIFASLTAPALAADMAVKAPPPPAPSPVYDWSGFYLGLEGGGGFGSTTHTNEVTGGTSVGNSDLRGGLFGGTYGYNWQSGHVVAGLEGDVSWSGITDTFPAGPGDPGFCTVAFPCYTNLEWLGTDRARLGYAFDRVLVYATGGVAYGDVLATIKNAGIFGIDSEQHFRVGYTVGAGVEAMIAPKWSVKLEYLYTDFGNHVGYTAFPPPPLEPEDVYLNSNIVRAGLDYHFSGPVAAKY
jgi:outer membrane immunogenic protein